MAVFLSDEQDAPADADDLVALARYVLEERGVPEVAELSLLLVDRGTITALNAEHRDLEEPTDVLAFPIDPPTGDPSGPPPVLGDVVVCPEVAAEQAAGAGHDRQEELRLLTVHGILHLLGMDHDEPGRRREMFSLTDRLLAGYRSRDDGRSAS